MQLKLLREHYVYRTRLNKWVPKRSFNSKKEVEKQLGFSKNYRAYKCEVCDKFHITTVPIVWK